jgi:putative toxin-antitoxin system antitoxin component (TIGR02293 family)
MAKAAKSKKYTTRETEAEDMQLNEPAAVYGSPLKRMPVIADFTYKKFEKIEAKIPFTQKEWANILHLSERTLQRYAKENKSFEGLYVDRILHIEQLVDKGLDTFHSPQALYEWLKKDKKVMGQVLNFDSLYSTQGIQDTIDQIGRIQYGVYS